MHLYAIIHCTTISYFWANKYIFLLKLQMFVSNLIRIYICYLYNITFLQTGQLLECCFALSKHFLCNKCPHDNFLIVASSIFSKHITQESPGLLQKTIIINLHYYCIIQAVHQLKYIYSQQADNTGYFFFGLVQILRYTSRSKKILL